MKITLLMALLAALPAAALAADSTAHGGHASKYVGEEKRAIKSLSPSDIEELQRGGGWGLAKAAELNGVPGPIHLLELKDEIPLTAEQIAAVEGVYNEMNAQARRQGEILISLEQGLEREFQDSTITEERLREHLTAIGEARTELRYIHLSAHLETPRILSEEQIARYNALRGYGSNDPCASVPEGHSETLWRLHNGCD